MTKAGRCAIINASKDENSFCCFPRCVSFIVLAAVFDLVCLKLSGGEYIVCCERQVEPILRKQKPPACLAAVFDLVCLKLSGGEFETKCPEQIQ